MRVTHCSYIENDDFIFDTEEEYRFKGDHCEECLSTHNLTTYKNRKLCVNCAKYEEMLDEGNTNRNMREVRYGSVSCNFDCRCSGPIGNIDKVLAQLKEEIENNTEKANK